ncbi:MAG: putative glycoside hydrolase [Treponemataceae bacterium]|nr:putative glycoside hydrolase [Treponemataceae bacterium]
MLFIFCTASFIYANSNQKIPFSISSSVLAGNENGLYKIAGDNVFIPLWTEGSVKKILKTQEGWFFLTSEGILYSQDLVLFEYRNQGLPVNVIKTVNGQQKTFNEHQKDLKDIAVHPDKNNIVITATKDSVYISYDYGLNWKSIGLNARTSGVKCLTVFDQPVYDEMNNYLGTELVIYISHSIYGFSYYKPEIQKPEWIDMEAGFVNLQNEDLTDELASMLLVKSKTEKNKYDLYMGASYIPRIYKLNWQEKKAEVIWQEADKNATQDNLVKIDDTFVYLGMNGFKAVDEVTGSEVLLPEPVKIWENLIDLSDDILSIYIPEMKVRGKKYPSVSLNELWMLKERQSRNQFYEKINKVKGIYVPANQIADQRLNNHIKTLKDNNLNAIVVDMKDDAGLLRFDARTPLVKEMGDYSRYAVKLDEFVTKMKAENIYLIARIVVFKDKNLYRYGKNKYAVWDKKFNYAWRGIRGYVDKKDENGEVIGKEADYYDEFWVDPYCEKVWEYNVAIAQELIERGFDEIQFDYIRFPTDGFNLQNASYRYREYSMDKESALISFLKYARENIKAPIGIDIYGSNGWYRSSARTGQDVELMSNYVDVICPMFYPSHFEQKFLNYPPREERPYRIYNFGSYRNNVIGRNKIIVRPWIQAFFLRVSYDVKYYDKDYVKREIYGVRDSTDNGYLYWNNVGRYSDISPDPADEKYPWAPVESVQE